jgi:ATP-dependent RNA helicase DeaD
VRPKGTDGAHTDIEFQAHAVAFGDRLAAVINVLRMHADEKAIVFGTTREGVASLHQHLAAQGFRAVVLSGDRAQAERNRALAALKQGEAQILVATNVAARGLDLPEVDLVVHADLPLNAESLTHRSGRTGRAGRKGTSVLIAEPAEQRKAERLLAAAKANFVWSVAPSAEAVAEAARQRLQAEILAAPLPADDAVKAWARHVAHGRSKDELIDLLLARELSRCSRGEALKPVDRKHLETRPRIDSTDGKPRRKREDFDRSSVIFRVNLGAKDKAEPGWLLPLICRRGGVTRNEVGAIRIGPSFSDFQIAGDAASDFALAAAQPDPRAPHVVIEAMADAQRSHPQPQRRVGVFDRAAAPEQKRWKAKGGVGQPMDYSRKPVFHPLARKNQRPRVG